MPSTNTRFAHKIKKWDNSSNFQSLWVGRVTTKCTEIGGESFCLDAWKRRDEKESCYAGKKGIFHLWLWEEMVGNWPWPSLLCCLWKPLLFLMRLYWPFSGVKALIFLQFTNTWITIYREKLFFIFNSFI